MKKIAYMALLVILFVAGCQLMLEQHERELTQTLISKEIAHKQFEMTVFQVAALKAYMGDDITAFPAKTVTAIYEVEELALSYDPNAVTDTDLGRMFGLRAKIFCDITRQIVGPELSRYWP